MKTWLLAFVMLPLLSISFLCDDVSANGGLAVVQQQRVVVRETLLSRLANRRAQSAVVVPVQSFKAAPVVQFRQLRQLPQLNYYTPPQVQTFVLPQQQIYVPPPVVVQPQAYALPPVQLQSFNYVAPQVQAFAVPQCSSAAFFAY